MGYSLTQKPDGSFALHNNLTDTEVFNLNADDSVDGTFVSDSTEAAVSVEPLTISTTMTGIGGVGGRARFFMTTNVALGGWANALKGEVTWGATGRVTGLGSAILAEMKMSAGTSSGSYAPLEVELVMPTNAVTGTRTSFMSLNVSGAAAGVFDDNGFLFDVNGLTGSDAGHLFDELSELTNAAIQARLRINVNGTAWYIGLSDTATLQ